MISGQPLPVPIAQHPWHVPLRGLNGKRLGSGPKKPLRLRRISRIRKETPELSESALQVVDSQTLVKKHFFVFRDYPLIVSEQIRAIQVISPTDIFNPSLLFECVPGVLEQGVVVGFQKQMTAGFENFVIDGQKGGARQPALDISLSGSGVGKWEPDRRHLSLVKEGRKKLNLGSQKGDVGERLIVGGFTSGVNSAPLDIYSDAMAFRTNPCEAHRVLPPAAPKLQGNFTGSLEVKLVPPPLYDRKERLTLLDYVAAIGIVLESGPYILTHYVSFNASWQREPAGAFLPKIGQSLPYQEMASSDQDRLTRTIPLDSPA